MRSTNVANAKPGRHVRALAPLYFPSEAEMPEGKRHLELRTALYAIFTAEFGARACIGSDQFVYWNAREPKRCLAPDAFLKLGAENELFESWKTWERGTPELAVEVASKSDTVDDEDWAEKLVKYHELGVRELVLFDPRAPRETRLRIWERVDDDLIERRLDGEGEPFGESSVLEGYVWVGAPLGQHAAAPRLARGTADGELVFTPDEAREAAEQAREAAEHRAASAERRLAELEAELAKLRG